MDECSDVEPTPAREPTPPHRLENQQRENRRQNVERDHDVEHRDPTGELVVQHRRDRAAEHGPDALCDIQKSVVRRPVLGSVGIGQRARKKRENLAPPEEDETRQKHESD